jgi:hypothetical protein
MFFKSKQRPEPVGGDSYVRDVFGDAAWDGKSREWLAWWRSAQRVSRAWNEWLAADSSRRPDTYHHYLSALAAEERAAAELERSSQCA